MGTWPWASPASLLDLRRPRSGLLVMDLPSQYKYTESPEGGIPRTVGRHFAIERLSSKVRHPCPGPAYFVMDSNE